MADDAAHHRPDRRTGYVGQVTGRTQGKRDVAFPGRIVRVLGSKGSNRMQAMTSNDIGHEPASGEPSAPGWQGPPPPPPQPFIPSGVSRWQTLASLAGLLLASTCFMPAALVFNSPIFPFRDLWYGTASFPEDPMTARVIHLVFGFCMAILAYSFGGLEALAAILRRARLNTWNQRVGRATNVYLWGIVTLYVAGTAHYRVIEWEGPSGWGFCTRSIGISALILVHLWRSRRLASRRWLAQSFLGSLVCFLWFSFCVLQCLHEGTVLYGLTLSWIASTLLLLAAIGEARAVARTSWFMTVLLLLISRLPEGYHSGHCPQCDYNLYGLPEPRCPECGRPFTPDEAAANP